jgi:DNA-binding transcriptional LysR family regulator
MTHFGLDSWSFPPVGHSTVPLVVQFTPRFIVNTIRAAIASAVAGHGVTRMFSYHVAQEVKQGTLEIVLRDSEHGPLPVHLITPQGRLSVPKVRAFVDFATPRLRRHFKQLHALVQPLSDTD